MDNLLNKYVLAAIKFCLIPPAFVFFKLNQKQFVAFNRTDTICIPFLQYIHNQKYTNILQ